ncbi:MAG: HAMP domain-containing histidine kinase [Deltaproteobacteria bacterium]|nr:HAMP domain-containing histidine kinase [Deltaproteobacteria bacterium]
MDQRNGTAEQDRLVRALRITASQTSGIAGGGATLLFAAPDEDGGKARLRAAAGLRTAEEARKLAAQLESLVGEVLVRGVTRNAPSAAPVGGRVAPEGVHAFPLVARQKTLGVLAVFPVEPLSAEAREAIETLAWATACQMDHPGLAAQCEALASPRGARAAAAGEQSDELLRLSEELFAQDIELLRSNEKLGKIEKLKNDFIEKMSRELRTPLNSIIEATITVLSSENENLSPASRQTLRSALDEGTAFQRTLQNILDLWRLKQNEFPVEIQELSVSDVIDETIFSVQDGLRDKPVEIQKEIPEPIGKLRTDLGKLNQILFHLLDNAVKFTERGTIKIGARLTDGRLHCWVDDTGIGICADDQRCIWDEFYQVDDRASARYRGAGLGLTLVHDLLVLLEGDSTLRSEPGIGTRVEFSLPVAIV